MSKRFVPFASVVVSASLLSGCSLFFTDHGDDYQDFSKTNSALITPEGSIPSRDVLVIPNENVIADLSPSKPFVIPRAPDLYHPMAAVGVIEEENTIVFSVPADQAQSKKIVTDFLAALYGAGESVASQTDNQILSTAFDFKPQGWWASLYSNITRLYPAKTVFSFEFKEEGSQTVVTLQFREEVRDAEPTEWMSPANSVDAYSVAVRLWGTFGRQIEQSSAYLSNRDDASIYPIWIDHRGLFAVHLKDNTPSVLKAALNAAGLYLVSDSEQLLSAVPVEDIARIGDVIDFSISTGDGKEQKLFNVRRRDLDDVSWDLREYPYKITQQKAGYFLVIDVSSQEQETKPEIVSYNFAKRFIK